MHIAICDDNIADRKQLERLLDRESDRRKGTSGVFFCDSYGNSEHLSRNPMPYELFFLDMTSEEPTVFPLPSNCGASVSLLPSLCAPLPSITGKH